MQGFKVLRIILGPLIGIVGGVFVFWKTGEATMSKMAAIALWMAVWWILESVSLYLTSLIPLSLLPLLGIMNMKDVAPLYTNEVIFLFIGGFLLAFALEKWNLHKRIALKILMHTGKTPSSVLLGFMLCSFFLSMWISNIATTMMLLPAVIAVSAQLESQVSKNNGKITIALLLGLAYASSIGGTATLIGTAPNIIFSGFFNSSFPNLEPLNFGQWILFGLPVAICFLLVSYLVIRKRYFNKGMVLLSGKEMWRTEYVKLGKMGSEEKIVMFMFLLTVLLWFFRADLEFGNLKIRGWVNIFPKPDYITDSTIAILMSSLLFLIPSKAGHTSILSWEEAKKIPLGILFLFGGGFALAKGISVSGLSQWMAGLFSGINGLHIILTVAILCAFMTFFTELTSNTAATYLVLPILLALSENSDAHPLLIMMPVVFSASFAFMLPVATPPNTVVFGTEKLPIKEMMKTGLILNIIGIILITVFTFTLGKLVFGI